MFETELTDGSNTVTIGRVQELVAIPGGGEFKAWRVTIIAQGSLDSELARRAAVGILRYVEECVKLNQA